MASVSTYRTDSFDTATTTRAVPLSTHVSGDLLVATALKHSNTGDNLTVSAGWTLVTLPDATAGGSAKLAMAWKVAGGPSETSPTFTGTASGVWTTSCSVIKGADNGAPIDATAGATVGSGWSGTGVGITTATNNALILNHVWGFRGGTMALRKLGKESIDRSHASNSSHGMTYGFGLKETAGLASASTLYVNSVATTSLYELRVSIKDNASPTHKGVFYLGNTHDDIYPFSEDAGTQFGYTAIDASTVLTTYEGYTMAIINLARGATDGTILGLPSTEIRSSATGGAYGWIADFATGQNFTGKRFGVHIGTSQFNTFNDITEPHFSFVFIDTSNRYRAFNTFVASETYPVGRVTPSIVDPSNTSFMLGETAGFDITNVRYVGIIFTNAEVSSGTFYNMSMFMSMGTITVGGGTSANPVNRDDVWHLIYGLRTTTARRQGISQIFLSSDIAIGNGSSEVHVDLSNTSFNFPRQADGSNRAYLTDPDLIGFAVNLNASSSINLRNASFNGGQSYTWKIDPSCSTSADFSDFANFSIINATVTLKVGITMNRVTFSGCSEIDGQNITFNNCNILNPRGVHGMKVDASTVLNNIEFTTDQASDYALDITTAGTYNISGVTFNGFTTDIDVTAVSGTVTLQLGIGQATPTYQTAGATVVIAPAELDITFNNLTSAHVQIIEDDGTTVNQRHTFQTGSLVVTIPNGSTGTWKYVVDRAGYNPLVGSFDASSLNDFTVDGVLTQKLLADGTAMYQGTSSGFLSVVPNPDGSRLNLRVGDGAVSAQNILDETEDALLTQDGMTYQSNGGGLVNIALLPVGQFVFMGVNVRVIRDTAPDANATINAFVQSEDGIVLDAVNGSVQFVTPNTNVNIVSVNDIAVTSLADFKADVSLLATQASVDTVDTVVDAIKVTTDANLDATVSSRATPAQVATELATYDAPTKAELDSAQSAIIAEIDANEGKIDTVVTNTNRVDALIENVGGDRFTTKALETAPTDEMNAGELHTALDSYANKNDWKATVDTASIADAVWDEAYTDHTTAGSFGKLMDVLRKSNLAMDGSVTGNATTLSFDTDLADPTGTHDHQIVLFTTGALEGQSRPILTFTNGVNNTITLQEPLTTVPSIADEFVVLPQHIHPITQIQAGLATATDVSNAQTAIIAEVDANETKIDALETKAQADARQALLIAEHDATQAQVSGLNDLSTADIDARLNAYDAPTKAELDSAQSAIIAEIDANEAKIDTVVTNTNRVDALIENVGGDRLTTKALEQSPTAEMDAGELHTALDSYINKADWKADVSLLATQASVDALNDISTADLATALTNYDAPTKAEMDSAFASLNDLSTADIDARLTAYGLPTLTELTSAFTEIKGATWTTTDTLEAIRDSISGSALTAGDVWAHGTRTLTAGTKDSEIDAIKSKTDNLPADPASESNVSSVLTIVQLLEKYHDNNVKFFDSDGTTEVIQANAYRMTVYDNDGTTPLKTIEFRNSINSPTQLSNATRYVKI